MSNHSANNDKKSNVRTSQFDTTNTAKNASLSNARNSSSTDELKPIERKQAELAITKDTKEILAIDAKSHAINNVPLCSAHESSFYRCKPTRTTTKRASSSRNKQRSHASCKATEYRREGSARRESMYSTSLCLLTVLYLYAIIVSMCCADYMELGSLSSCAVMTSQDDAVKCWGSNSWGQLGQGDTVNRGHSSKTMGIHLPAIDFGAGFRVKFLSPSRGYHRCVISDANETKCIGPNTDGQLGYGDNSDRGVSASTIGDALLPIDLGDDFSAWKVVCGRYHTCSVSVANAVKCWGFNLRGQLGYNDTVDRGTSTTDMGNNLSTVNVGDGFLVMDIAAGAYHTCARSAAGTVKCWGLNRYGQLGYGDTVSRLAPGPEVDLGVDFFVVQICAGYEHTCALSSAGDVACWGHNYYGQLGIESPEWRIGDEAGEMGVNLTTVDLGPDFFVVAIACGDYHNCALSDGNNIKCWGYNQFGRLGYNDTEQRGSRINTMGSYLLPVDVGSDFVPKEVKCGASHTCSTSQDDRMKCWGYNEYGQLGYEDAATYRLQMGDDDLDVINLLDYTLTPTTDPTTPTAAPTFSPTTSPTQSPEEVANGASDCYKVIIMFALPIISYLHL